MYVINITRDTVRNGYWVRGDGFDFFAYFTSGPEGHFLECDRVQREDDAFILHLYVKLGPSGLPHADILETAIQRELGKYWPTNNWGGLRLQNPLRRRNPPAA